LAVLLLPEQQLALLALPQVSPLLEQLPRAPPRRATPSRHRTSQRLMTHQPSIAPCVTSSALPLLLAVARPSSPVRRALAAMRVAVAENHFLDCEK
jgi:hypothetical protein